jgi:hypothetical protein
MVANLQNKSLILQISSSFVSGVNYIKQRSITAFFLNAPTFCFKRLDVFKKRRDVSLSNKSCMKMVKENDWGSFFCVLL